jgi:multiple sugar transport system ATP-binding protein
MNLYERPANLFVAGFVGSPAMNLLRGTLRQSRDWVLSTGHGEVALGPSLPQPGWLAWAGREVVLGIRPEHLQPRESGPHALQAELEVLEPVGNEIFLNLRYGSQALVSRVSPRALPAPGCTLSLGLVLEHLHLFDPVSGVRIES